MKRRTLTIVVGLLLTLSLVGVGFASWVISAKDEETIIGNVEVQTVTDRRLDITVKSLSYAFWYAIRWRNGNNIKSMVNK